MFWQFFRFLGTCKPKSPMEPHWSCRLGTAVLFIKFILPDFSDLCSTITRNLRPVPKSLVRCRNQWRTIIRNPPRVPKTPQKDKNPWGTFTKNFPCVPNSQFMGNNFKKSFLCFFKFLAAQYIMVASASIATVQLLSYLLGRRIAYCSVIHIGWAPESFSALLFNICCNSGLLSALLFISAAIQDRLLFCYSYRLRHRISLCSVIAMSSIILALVRWEDGDIISPSSVIAISSIYPAHIRQWPDGRSGRSAGG